jgi:hypothetical protein
METKVKLVAGKLQIWIMGVSNVQDATEAKVKLMVLLYFYKFKLLKD